MKKIYIVGIGPGDLCQMTNEAVSVIEESEQKNLYVRHETGKGKMSKSYRICK